MLFHTWTFLVFFIIVFSLYLLTQSRLKLQNGMLLVASYIFYAWWDWRFLGLLVFSTVTDHLCALWISRTVEPRKRKGLLLISVIINLGILGFFKYFNFFAGSFESLVQALGWSPSFVTLNIVLPVGVSFYTFQSMSYVIDVYRKTLKPTENLLDFALFVSFFPQLVAGPIERAAHLLPQILKPRRLNPVQFSDGGYLIFLGLFQKIFIADNLAKLTDKIFAFSQAPDGVTVLIGLYAFAFQIFCDFAGYSNIARGLAKCMGFEIMVNFNAPYFSRNPSEFWQRWHISLSAWLRDYLYIPLGGNRKGSLITYRNLFLTMLLGGLWHGASWTFVIWGAYHGILLILHRLLKPVLNGMVFIKGRAGEFAGGLFCKFFFFHLVCLGWLFFRAQSLSQAVSFLKSLFQLQFAKPELLLWWNAVTAQILPYTALLLILETAVYWKKDDLAVLKWPAGVRSVLYLTMFYSMVLFGAVGGSEFIYFQF